MWYLTTMTRILSVSSILHTVTSWKEITDTEEDCAEIWNAEHLQDILCNKENIIMRNALLITYGPPCKSTAEAIWAGLLEAPLPTTEYLTMLRHDHLSAPNNSWFNYGETYNLTNRLHLKNCLEVHFLREGTTLDHYLKYPTEDYKNIVNWIWDNLQINISVYNDMEKPLRVFLEGYIPNEKEQFSLEANQIVSLTTYASNFVILYSTTGEEFLNGYQLRSNIAIKVTGSSRYKGKEEVWRIKSHFEHRENEESSKLFLCSHHRRHFNILTQPQTVPSFTNKGYMLTKIPSHVFEMLLQIYEQNKYQLTQEYYPNYFTVWNLDEINIKQVTLSEGKTLYLAEELQPIVEKWCNCALHPTTGEGIVTRIRMYPKGSRVRMHVDELESGHVIGAILQIAQDPNTEKNGEWPLEVINFNGKREEILMKPGHMVLFESSRLVHGRPKTLKGEYYVNSFFYYVPNSGWNVGARGSFEETTVADLMDSTSSASTTPEFSHNHKSHRRSLGRADEL